MQPSGLIRVAARPGAAAMLLEARCQRRQLAGLPGEARPRSIDEGYAIQDELVRLIGTPVVGWKVGSTARAAQQRVGATEPFAGRILKDQIRLSPAVVEPQESFLRAVQVEFAFRLGRDLCGHGPIDRDAAAAAVDAVLPTIEIADTRYADWANVGAASLIADNAKDGLVVLGSAVEDWRAIDLAKEPARLFVNGRLAAEGTGARVLGHPLHSLTWLANDRLRRSDALRAGQIVSTGTCIDNFYAQPGDVVVARFQSLQPVEVAFKSSTP